jgi:hypothetical protein
MVLLMSSVGRPQSVLQQEKVGATSPAAVASPRIGAISGRVVTDSGQPLEGATVYLQKAGGTTPVRLATTDEDGQFRVGDLPYGVYTAVASARGYFMPIQHSTALGPTLYRLGESIDIAMVKGGVVTGRVLDARGEAVVGVTVRAIQIRDAEGVMPDSVGLELGRQTDDRGIYRLYGLRPGTYVVAAGPNTRPSRVDSYKYDAPSYYPSGTRDTASDVRVDAGSETSNVDIRYLGARGHMVSGDIIGLAADTSGSLSVTLGFSGSDIIAASTTAPLDGGNRRFTLYGVADGEYDLLIRGISSPTGRGFVASRHIAVKGGDVSGLSILPTPLGSLAGHIQLESRTTISENTTCNFGRESSIDAVLLSIRRSNLGESKQSGDPTLQTAFRGFADGEGRFKLDNLEGGDYRIEARLLSEAWYVQSIALLAGGTSSTSDVSSKATDIGRYGLTIKPGEQQKEVVVILAYGASSLRGRIAWNGNVKLPEQLCVYLVPAEREHADEPLRYAEAIVAEDGTFALKNLPPGRYWAVTRSVSFDEPNSRYVWQQTALSKDNRAQLQNEGMKANIEVVLRPCQQITEYSLPYSPRTQLGPRKSLTPTNN